MKQCHLVKLEIVRPGPPHNQLLSPLTPYMALCGEGLPVTFNLDFEHHQFMHSLALLRYVTRDGRSGVAIPDPIRENAVDKMGASVGKIFHKINTLLAMEWQVLGDVERKGDGDEQIVDLRIIISGSELSLIPFEMAIAPQSFPGEGFEWAMQHHLPIVPIRQIRTNRPAPVRWDRSLEPKILFISAAPQGMDVPLAPHIQTLREALDPWIQRPSRRQAASDASSDAPDLEKQRLVHVKERLRLIPNASIDDIYAHCAAEQFTHVHILAHGAEMEIGGEKRHGLALCDPDNRNKMCVISGKRLAKALLAESEDGTRRSHPVMVTLATCDSGNPGSVLIPGGGIAHDLHASGIPWVLASQLPLTKVGSVRMTNTFYRRILRGDDPRRALYEVRRQLFMNAERDHDWASIVAYATIPDDFDNQVSAFFERQMRRAITVALNHADNSKDDGEMEGALNTAIGKLALWKNRLPEGKELRDRERRVECYGMYGSTWKRIALLYYKDNREEEGRDALERSLDSYSDAIAESAMKESRYHWVATQALSLKAVVKKDPDPETWLITRKFAERDLAKSEGSAKAWAHGTMAELIMLAKYHIPDEVARNVKKMVKDHCEAIVRLMGEESFEVYSTRRQFQRYVKYWPDPDWNAIAKAAVAALSPSGDEDQSGLPPYA